ncbi:MAG: UDP-N-acetylglucosamine 2-epimerase [Bacteroidota bacterium]
MGKPAIKTAILTSSRADFGIYLPLAGQLQADDSFDLEIIAFGTHPAEKYGYSLQHIMNAGLKVAYSFDTTPENDQPADISRSMALVNNLMADVWEHKKYDIVFALGDRYEMFSAVASAMPFNLKIAHIHGGETTLGAIDNAFRHSITHMSHWHFACTEAYKNRITELTGNKERTYNTGALGIDNLTQMQFLDVVGMKEKSGIDFSLPSLLVTLHPETIGYEENIRNTDQLLLALEHLDRYQQVITMPNADTSGLMIRQRLTDYAQNHQNVKLIENFGTQGYLSAMKLSSLMLGNSSSGFIEASHFPKWVINLGHRQDGRFRTPNIVDAEFSKDKIIEAIDIAATSPLPVFSPVYGNGHAAEKIVKILKHEFAID